MTLKDYRKKRNFKKTLEPIGNKEQKTKNKLYVIQKHAASHLHYDLRLQVGSILKSWAVPKEPSLDPNIKRLAVHVEDHPLAYGSFEGVIPAGQYGAGTVKIWDKGTWELLDENFKKAYTKGHFTFILYGKKLKGTWRLIQIKTSPKNWLLTKVVEEHISKKIDNKQPRIKKSKMPVIINPQLATIVERPPEGKQWLHEIKFDGYRILCFINNGKVKLMTRSHQDWTKKFDYLVNYIQKLNLKDSILDGEVVVLDKKQHSNFQLLQNAINKNDTKEIIYYIFDLIYYDDNNLSEIPLKKRKELLYKIIPFKQNSCLRYSDHIIGNGEAIYKKSCQLGLEGVISKSVDSAYTQKRTRNWLKSKCKKRQEFVVGGFTKPKSTRKYFGSLLLEIYTNEGNIKYCGHVGTGFNEETLELIWKMLQKKKASHSFFANKPPDIKNISWTNPEIIAEVEFTEWTREGILRHPSFKGVRTDKSPKKITQEIPSEIITRKYNKDKKTRRDFNYPLTNSERVLYPELNITKIKLAKYYESIQEWILPYIINRPLTLLRCPEGYQNECFYQKHFTEAKIKSLYSIDIKEKNKVGQYFYIKDIKGLISLIQIGTLEIHAWNCHVSDTEKSDVIIFDLDPGPSVEWKKVIKSAYFIKEQLENISLLSFVKTTGGKGLHIVVPIKKQYSWQDIKLFTKTFVEFIAEKKPNDFTSVMTKSKRTNKIYIDYLRNQQGATSIAPYSTRARTNAPVATPISWSELTTRIQPATFNIQNLPLRLAKLKNNPWEYFFKIHQSLHFK